MNLSIPRTACAAMIFTLAMSAHADSGTPITQLPYTITQCGTYHLRGCLSGKVGLDGIIIDADNVTLDLNGFSLTGIPGSGDGIEVINLHSNITIKNGKVSNWGIRGIAATLAMNSRLENLQVSNNGTAGIFAGGENTTIVNCSAMSNAATGIFAKGTIINSSAKSNGGDGIIVDGASLVQDCLSTGNTGNGFKVDSRDSSLIGNVANSNTGAGIYVTFFSNRIEGNYVSANFGAGILMGAGAGANTILKNVASQNAPNYSLGGNNNAYGPIVDITSDGDITGTPNADHPWANFSMASN